MYPNPPSTSTPLPLPTLPLCSSHPTHPTNLSITPCLLVYPTNLSIARCLFNEHDSLEPGEPWDVAAFTGMLKSKIFIPLISRGALQRIAAMERDTPCDNMYLEFSLALELRERGSLDKVFPLMLGDHDQHPPPPPPMTYPLITPS